MSKYKFEGYTITNCGYHQPDHCVWWEAIDDSGCACFHATTLREIEFMILESKWKDEHEREVAELKNKCEEYERQPELMAETAKAALELLKAQESKIAELRECLKDAIHTECKLWDQSKADCEKCLLANDCRAKTWRKALEGENND